MLVYTLHVEPEVKDQVPADSPPVTDKAPKGAKVITKDQAPKEQSETTKVASEETPKEEEVFEDHMGRKLTSKQLHTEYVKSQSYITKLEQKQAEWEKSAQKEASKAIAENDYLKDVDPNVREAIIKIVTPVIEDSLKRKDAEIQKRAQDEAFTKRLDELEAKYKGGNGLPKFERAKVLAAMQDPTNNIFDPEWKFKEMNYATLMDHEIKQAIKGKSGEVETESTGGAAPRKPDATKSPKTFEEASKSFFNRLSS